MSPEDFHDNDKAPSAEPTSLAESRHETWRPVARLALIVAAIVALAIYFHIGLTILVVLAIVVMIMVHEFGHYLMAKASKMKVTEYFLGFGPRIWSFKRGETEYGIKAIPAGGYVKIVGMTNLEPIDEQDEPRAYRNSTYPRRLAVSLAGSATHFIMAYLILVCSLPLSVLRIPQRLRSRRSARLARRARRRR